MPLSVRLDGWGRPACLAAVLAVSWVSWPLGLVLLLAFVWLGLLGARRSPAWPRHNPFDLFWRRFYRIGSAEEERPDDAEPPAADAEDFAEYLERLRRTREGRGFEPAVTGPDRAGFA